MWIIYSAICKLGTKKNERLKFIYIAWRIPLKVFLHRKQIKTNLCEALFLVYVMETDGFTTSNTTAGDCSTNLICSKPVQATTNAVLITAMTELIILFFFFDDRIYREGDVEKNKREEKIRKWASKYVWDIKLITLEKKQNKKHRKSNKFTLL